MTLKDNLGNITKHPQEFVKNLAATKLQSVAAIDPLERSLHKLQSLSLSAQQHIMWRVAKDKWSDAVHGPIDKIYELLRPGAERRRDARTRAACLAIAQRRIDAVQTLLLATGVDEIARRIDARRPRFVPVEGSGGGQVTLTPRARQTQEPGK